MFSHVSTTSYAHTNHLCCSSCCSDLGAHSRRPRRPRAPANISGAGRGAVPSGQRGGQREGELRPAGMDPEPHPVWGPYRGEHSDINISLNTWRRGRPMDQSTSYWHFILNNHIFHAWAHLWAEQSCYRCYPQVLMCFLQQQRYFSSTTPTHFKNKLTEIPTLFWSYSFEGCIRMCDKTNSFNYFFLSFKILLLKLWYLRVKKKKKLTHISAL